MKKRYEVQHFSFFDGWVNTWSFQEKILDGIFTEVPETFATRKEAQAALDEFLRFTQDEIDTGQRAAAEGYDPDDFRIAQVQLARAGVP